MSLTKMSMVERMSLFGLSTILAPRPHLLCSTTAMCTPAQQLVDEFDLLPLPRFGTDNGGIASHHVEQRLHGCQRGLRAADHDQQITLPRPGRTTGNGGVDDLHTRRGQSPRPVLDGGGPDG